VRDADEPSVALVEKILDKTGMKGTGRWTIQEAAERSIAAPTMAAALDTRYLSGLKEERVAASAVLHGPPAESLPKVDKAQLISDVRQALYAAKICSYAQGMNLIREAAKQLGWSVDLGECARIWKGGCIIREWRRPVGLAAMGVGLAGVAAGPLSQPRARPLTQRHSSSRCPLPKLCVFPIVCRRQVPGPH
jgi:hypothetical protein